MNRDRKEVLRLHSKIGEGLYCYLLSAARVGAKDTSRNQEGWNDVARHLSAGAKYSTAALNAKNIGHGREAVKARQRQIHSVVTKARGCMRECWPVQWMAVIGRWLQNSLPHLGP